MTNSGTAARGADPSGRCVATRVCDVQPVVAGIVFFEPHHVAATVDIVGQTIRLIFPDLPLESR